jgi:esterase/lipase superfamily enzyme
VENYTICRRWLLGMVLGMFLVGFPGSKVEGALVAQLQLVNDGSANPPGDRLDLAVILLPDEGQVTLEVRGFVRSSGSDEVRPLLGKLAEFRGTEGELLVRRTVARPDLVDGSRLQLVIPYAAIELAPGEYEIGYEVRGLRGEEVDFVRATPMVAVKVSDRNRKTMAYRPPTPPSQVERVERDGYVLKDGKLEPTTVRLEVAAPVQQAARAILQVEIPGEFSHPTPMRAPPAEANPPLGEAMPRPGEARPRPEAAADSNVLLPLGNVAWDSLDKFEPESKRVVYFATNRQQVRTDSTGVDRFGKELGPLSYGRCRINIPVETHSSGKLEVPSWWQRRNPEKHFIVELVSVLERADFLKETTPGDILLFIHGYNTAFEFSVLRTAQVVHDLRFPGRGVAFSWPSAATLSGYFHDEQVNEASINALVEVLRELVAKRPGADRAEGRIHVIAHSMGNRLFLKAARQLELETQKSAPEAKRIFGHVALAAPDVDATTFSALLPSVIRQAEHVTFYYCQSDRALAASRAIHVDKPVGLGPFFADGLDTINADQVNTEILGHGYFASAHQLLLDLNLLLRFNLEPDQRQPPLSVRSEYFGYPHWTLSIPR